MREVMRSRIFPENIKKAFTYYLLRILYVSMTPLLLLGGLVSLCESSV